MDLQKMLSDHKAESRELKIRKLRNDKGVDRAKYTKILPDKYRSYISRCNKIGREFNLTVSEFDAIISNPCVYCGSTSKMCIDRIDSRGGYTIENTQPSCNDCNMMKGVLTSTEFVSQIKKIYKNIINK